MIVPDPTTEIKEIRHRLGASFDYDLNRIFADIERRQNESGITYVTLTPRRVANIQPLRGSCEVSSVEAEAPPSPS
jgi:hypothetical protein